MRKKLKPDHYYIIVNLDEPYAEDVFEVLKYGQMHKGEWPEGDVGFEEWVRETWRGTPDYNGAVHAALGRYGWEAPLPEDPGRKRFSLLANLHAEREAADARIKELEAAIRAKCAYCRESWDAGLDDPAFCPTNCPLFPYRGGE